MHILITGGKGYVGARLAQHLINQHQVTVTSRNNSPFINEKVKVLKVNAEDDHLDDCLKNVDVIIHLAALDAPNCTSNPIQAANVNITQTVKWLAAAKNTGVKKFIYFSTVHVYGSQVDDIITEDSCTNNTHPYASTHKAAEDFVKYYHCNEMQTIVFRMSNAIGYTIGEMKQWHLIVPDLCKMAVENQRVTLQSNPLLQRNFIAMQSVCNIVSHFLNKADCNSETPIYNICSTSNVTLKEIASMVAAQYESIINKKIGISYLAEELEVKATKYSNQKLLDSGFNNFTLLDDEINLLLLQLLKK